MTQFRHNSNSCPIQTDALLDNIRQKVTHWIKAMFLLRDITFPVNPASFRDNFRFLNLSKYKAKLANTKLMFHASE